MSISGRAVRRLPWWYRRASLDATFAFLFIPSSVLALAGIGGSSALEEIMPWWGPRVFALAMLVGALAWLIGLTSAQLDHGTGAVILTRLPTFLLGLTWVSTTSLAYGIAVLAAAGVDALIPASFALAISGGTFVRKVMLVEDFRGAM